MKLNDILKLVGFTIIIMMIVIVGCIVVLILFFKRYSKIIDGIEDDIIFGLSIVDGLSYDAVKFSGRINTLAAQVTKTITDYVEDSTQMFDAANKMVNKIKPVATTIIIIKNFFEKIADKVFVKPANAIASIKLKK